MQFSVENAKPDQLQSACLVAGVFAGGKLTAAAQTIDKASHGYLSKLIKGGALEGRSGQTLLLFQVPGITAERLLLVGLGMEKDFKLPTYRKAMHQTVRALNDNGVKQATSTLSLLAMQILLRKLLPAQENPLL